MNWVFQQKYKRQHNCLFVFPRSTPGDTTRKPEPLWDLARGMPVGTAGLACLQPSMGEYLTSISKQLASAHHLRTEEEMALLVKSYCENIRQLSTLVFRWHRGMGWGVGRGRADGTHISGYWLSDDAWEVGGGTSEGRASTACVQISLTLLQLVRNLFDSTENCAKDTYQSCLSMLISIVSCWNVLLPPPPICYSARSSTMNKRYKSRMWEA